MNDNELVSATRAGNKAAFGVLVERYLPMVTRLAQHMTGDSEISHDLAQDTFLQAFLSLDSLRSDSSFKSWLYGITLHVCRSYLRSQRTNVYSFDSAFGGIYHDPSDYGPTPDEIAERRDLINLLTNAIGALSDANRAAVMLVYYEDLSLREASQLLRISVTALKGRLYKARLQLQAMLWQLQPIQPTESKQGVVSMIPVKIIDVRRSEILKDSSVPTAASQIVLYDEIKRRAIVIWAGEVEGLAILYGLTKFDFPRPMTQIFISRLIQAAQATVESVQINSLKDDIFYATVSVRAANKVQEVDARPSDALGLAVHMNAPIYVSDEVMEQAGQIIPEGKLPTGKGIADFLGHFQAQKQAWEQYRAKQSAVQSVEAYKQMLSEASAAVLLEAFSGEA